MRLRWVLTLVVALTVVIAGCTGTDAPADGAASGDTTTPADVGGTTPAGDGTGASDGGSSATLGDADALLQDARTFTATWSYTFVDESAAETAYEYVVAVDLAANRSFETSSMRDATNAVVFERYNADGTSYMKYGEGDQAVYMGMPQDSTPFADAVSEASIGDFDRFHRVGTETFDGVTVTRYEYADADLWRTYGLGITQDPEDVQVTDFTLTVLVDGNGLARSTSWTLTGETQDGKPVSGTWTYTLTDVGTTTVAEPDWLDAAKEQAVTVSG